MRNRLIAANWKMHKTPAESTAFLASLFPLVQNNTSAEIVICPAMTSLAPLADAARGSSIAVGAQTMHWLDSGAYTGETSPTMLTAMGVTHVLIGHSERRQYFNETDTTVNLKLKSALQHGLVPIVCVGEHINERNRDLTEDVLRLQISVALEGIDCEKLGPLVVAYEPVWAIGTGHTATPETAEDAHKIIRAEIRRHAGEEIAAGTRILYGGSVRPENAGSLNGMEDVDGALVGGASLESDSFAQIVALFAEQPA